MQEDFVAIKGRQPADIIVNIKMCTCSEACTCWQKFLVAVNFLMVDPSGETKYGFRGSCNDRRATIIQTNSQALYNPSALQEMPPHRWPTDKGRQTVLHTEGGVECSQERRWCPVGLRNALQSFLEQGAKPNAKH